MEFSTMLKHAVARRFLFVLACLSLAGCSTVSGTGRRQVNLYQPSDDATIGAQAWEEVLSDPKVVRTGPKAERVRRVGNRIVEAATQRHPEIASGFEWEFVVIDDPDQVNAFALPGGKFAVYTGMLELTAGNDDMLAAVLGHEAAHVTSRHGTERLTQLTITNAGIGATSIFLLGDLEPTDRDLVLETLGAGANFGVLLPFSRSHESEADLLGILIAAEAGYDPRAAIALWQRMAEVGGAQPTDFLSTHPSHQTRIKRLEEAMPEAERIRSRSSG
jgi:predicted Zn-dependent protease